MPNFSIEGVSLFIVGIVDVVLAAILYSNAKKTKSSFLFSLFTISVFGWVVTMALFQTISPYNEWYFFIAKFLYISAGFMPTFFVLFSFIFPQEKLSLSLRTMFAIIAPGFFAIMFVFFRGAVLLETTQQPYLSERSLLFGDCYLYYMTYAISYFVWGCYILFRKYRNTVGIAKAQIAYVLVGTIIPVIVASYTNLIGPYMGDFRFFWLGPVVTATMPIAVAYAIFKHHLFDLKILFTETLSLLIVFALSVELVLVGSWVEAVIKGTTLIFVCVLFYLLVRSVSKEVSQREKMEQLAKELELANEHLRVLDRQKSEFVSIASHQLRTPLTAIKGYSSMLLEGTYGTLPDQPKDVVKTIFLSCERLVKIVEEFLNISRIEQGKMLYEFTKVNIEDILKNLAEEYAARAMGKRQKFTFIYDKKNDYFVTADADKIRQVFSNIIDNAVKYTPEGGAIDIAISRDDDCGKVLVSVKDNGIGIPSGVISLLFQKFSRAEDVKKIHTEGVGLGLYIASEMVKAHRGKIWVESEGKEKGTTFFVELLAED